MNSPAVQCQAYIMANEILNVHESDDKDLYDEFKAKANKMYPHINNVLDWAGKVYLVRRLLDDIVGDIDISAGEDQLEVQFYTPKKTVDPLHELSTEVPAVFPYERGRS